MIADRALANTLSVSLCPQFHTFLRLARFQLDRLAGARRRLLGVEPERGNLNVLFAGTDERRFSRTHNLPN